MRSNLVRVLLAVTPFVGCHGTTYFAARAQAANDFGCKTSHVELASMGDHQYAARGCGRRAVYACTPEQPGEEYTLCRAVPAPSSGP